MANRYGPKIINDGLVLCIDAAGDNKSYPIDGLDVEYLIVAGGGGGGGVIGGGGGAGGLLYGSTKATIATGTYVVVVGAGGAGGTGWNTSGQDGKVGGDTSALGITANGGGGGDHHGGATSSTIKNGGSGGGGANGSYNGGTGISGQGNNGGNNGNGDLGAGGGGAGGVGSNAGNPFIVNSKGGAGGIGRYFGDKFGNTGYDGWFADGGGGGVRSYRGPYIPGVGSNGAGSGGFNSNDANINGNASANTGSGGGGGGYNVSYSSRSAGNGGSGVVLIRYSGPPRAKGGDSIISHNGYTIHVFNSSGNFIVGETAADLSTSKKYGTLTNMSSSDYTSGRSGYFSFDGSNQHISAGSGNSQISFGQSQSFTIEMVFSVNDYTAAQFLINRGSAPGSSNTDYTLLIESSRLIFGIGASQYTNSWAGGQTTAFNFNNTIMYLCGTVDSTGTHTGTKTLYKNGQQLTQVEYVNKTAATTVATGIGASTVHSIYYFDGSIYLTKMYNRALSSKEVLDNFNAIRGRYGL